MGSLKHLLAISIEDREIEGGASSLGVAAMRVQVAVESKTKTISSFFRKKTSSFSSFLPPPTHHPPHHHQQQRLPRQGHLRPLRLRRLRPPLRPLALDLFPEVELAFRRPGRRVGRCAGRAAGDELRQARGLTARVRALWGVRARDGLRCSGVVKAFGESGARERERKKNKFFSLRPRRALFAFALTSKNPNPPPKKNQSQRPSAPSPSPP